MTINERVQYLRRDVLHISQREFAEQIGLKQSAQSAIERGVVVFTDRNIDVLCNAYNVREDWLRLGIGEIFQEPDTFCLDDFVRERGGTDLELRIVKAYFELPEDIRLFLLEHFEAAVAQDPDTACSVEQLEDLYKKALQQRSAAAASALSTTADTGSAPDAGAG